MLFRVFTALLPSHTETNILPILFSILKRQWVGRVFGVSMVFMPKQRTTQKVSLESQKAPGKIIVNLGIDQEPDQM